MQTFWIGSDWKMKKTVADAGGSIASLLRETTDEVHVFVATSFTALSVVREAISVRQEC
jgi:triosephosphate isomerase